MAPKEALRQKTTSPHPIDPPRSGSPPTSPLADGSGGFTVVEYGESGNVASVLVRGQCEDAPSEVCTYSTEDGPEQRAEALIAGCDCLTGQYYQYRWDELNRLAEARRYDADESKDWALAVRQRYRYDAANQRTVKVTSDAITGKPRAALYAYPGDYERRGLSIEGTTHTYEPSSTNGSEDQYLVAGARYVRRDVTSTSTDGLDRMERVTVGLSDLLGTTSATIDLLAGEVVETSTYYPNGATETFRALEEPDGDFIAREPVGFTGKEADEEVGLVYFGERYLISRLGRWATPDPLHVHAVGGGEALNSYHYVSGNLLAARDPLGLDARRTMAPSPAEGRAAARRAREAPFTAQGRADGRAAADSVHAAITLNTAGATSDDRIARATARLHGLTWNQDSARWEARPPASPLQGDPIYDREFAREFARRVDGWAETDRAILAQEEFWTRFCHSLSVFLTDRGGRALGTLFALPRTPSAPPPTPVESAPAVRRIVGAGGGRPQSRPTFANRGDPSPGTVIGTVSPTRTGATSWGMARRRPRVRMILWCKLVRFALAEVTTPFPGAIPWSMLAR